MTFPVSQLAQFHFIRPEWFIALVPLAILFFLVRHWRQRQSGWQSVVASHLYHSMTEGKPGKGVRPPFWLLAFGWLIAVTALAGPTWERLPQPVYQLNTGHVLVLDMSLSMRATDVTPDRLTRAKYKAIDLINEIGEGEMGLVAYAGDAFVISPLTTDASNLTTLLPSLSPEIMPVAGSDPLLGIQTAAELLEQAGYNQGSIFWITDGIEREQQTELQDYVQGLPYDVSVMGVGTADGAPIKQVNGELLKQTSGAIVIPKMDDSLLRGIAQAGGGRYTDITPDDSDIAHLASLSLNQRQAGDSGPTDDRAGDQWQELGPYLLLLLLPFAAYAFRRGVLVMMLLPLLMPLSPPASAQKEEATTSTQDALPWWETPFLNRDQEGLASFRQEQFGKAAELFDDPSWQGAAQYKAGNYEAALASFSKLNTPDALYNQGNALARLGKLDDAIEKYDAVLAQQPDNKDAAENKALLEKLKQQQEQQQQQNQNNQNQQQDQQNQDDSNASQQGNGEDQNQQGEQNDSEPSAGDTDQSQQQNQDGGAQGEDNQQQPEQEQSADESEEQNDQKQDGEPQPTEQQDEQDAQQQAQSAAAAGELTDEEKEAQQRLDNLMRRVPDDPAFLLKRKMQLEAQQRRRQRMPTNQREW
ncbi:VWA domain-containing protein [Alteromonas sp. H39]|uniref:vWA domain-containing protein n=1 Tax=Alteromonas sp. H39 TaxID=3389876 RepID=UPI0039E05D74